MSDMVNEFQKAGELIAIAKPLAGHFALHGFSENSAGSVSAALLTVKKNIYTGICIDIACSMGFCAEHAASAEMLKNRETQIDMIVAVNESGRILPPCGRCREFLVQIDPANLDTKVILEENKIVLLRELLPYTWSI